MSEQRSSRRDFLRTSTRVVAGIALSATVMEILASCKTVPEVHPEIVDGTAVIPESAFMVDDERFHMVIVRIPGSKFPVAVVAPPHTEPVGLLMKCTHKGCPISAEMNGFSCSCHGSEFDQQGKVTTGPAKEHLATVPVVHDGHNYIVTLKDHP